MKLAVVVQRYGEDVNGGAELHARYVAEHLARHADVDVLTTCALDYVTWKNELRPGVEQINGITTRRFKVRHQRHPLAFGRWSRRVFDQPHSIGDELSWLNAEGPSSPALVRYIRRHRNAYDYFIFFSYRYYHAYHGARAAGPRAVLVPTAERDAAVGLTLFGPLFNGVRALMYNSPEERAMIQRVSGNQDVPSVVVGVGSEVSRDAQPGRFRQKYDVRGPFAIYVGRIDENKGCGEMFDYFRTYLDAARDGLSLVLVGNAQISIPDHPRIRHLGYIDDRDKFDAIAAAEVLLMPSYFESLSMVALEAWALERPVLANARCDVLKGQCLRSNAGLFYESRGEFIEGLRAIGENRWLRRGLGLNGRTFFRENYEWPIVERKYVDMLARLAGEASRTMAPLPGWLSRRADDCPPAAEVLERIPRGSIVDRREHVVPSTSSIPASPSISALQPATAAASQPAAARSAAPRQFSRGPRRQQQRRGRPGSSTGRTGPSGRRGA